MAQEKPHAVILNWKRPWNVEKIVDFLDKSNLFSGITVGDNSGLRQPDAPHLAENVTDLGRNLKTLGRLEAIRELRPKTVFTCDDDILPLNVAELLDAYDGEHITALLPNGNGSYHYVGQYAEQKKPWMMLGFGSVFEFEWMESAVGRWRSRYPDEEEMLESKFDRIFTMLYPKHYAIIADIEKLYDPDGQRSDTSKDAISRQPGHYDLVKDVAKMCEDVP